MTDQHRGVATTESFTLTVASDELDAVWEAIVSMRTSDVLGQRAWLITDGTSRLWIIGEYTTSVWLRFGSAPNDPTATVALPPMFLRQAVILANETGECEIALDAEAGVLSVTTAHEFHCTDFEPGAHFDPRWHPDAHPRGGLPVVSAHVDGEALNRLMRAVRMHPPNATIDTVPPFTALELAGGSLRATVDWRRSGGIRFTHAVPTSAPVEGEGRVSYLGHFAANFLSDRLFGEDESVTVWFRAERPEVLRFDADSGAWGCIVHIDRESALRWYERVVHELTCIGAELESGPSRPRNEIRFQCEGLDFVALIEPGDHASEDRVRLVTPLALGVAENIEVLREVNAFNLRWSEVKLVLEESTLFGVVDVRCHELDRIAGAVLLLMNRHVDLTPMLAVYA